MVRPPCTICGGQVTRHDGEAFDRFETRITCSGPCGREYQQREARARWDAAIAQHAKCRVCRKAFLPQKHEGLSRYIARDCCSKGCARKNNVKGGRRLTQSTKRGGLMKASIDISKLVDEWEANGGSIIICPPAFVTTSRQAPTINRTADEIKRLHAASEYKPLQGHSWLFAKPPRQ